MGFRAEALIFLPQKFYMGSAYFTALKKKEYIFTHLLGILNSSKQDPFASAKSSPLLFL